MLAYLAATACRPSAFATPPVRLPCRGAELPATRPPCPLAVRPPPSLLGAVAPPASLPPFSAWRRLPAPCRAAAVLPPVGHRCARPIPASPPVRLPCRHAGYPALRALPSTLPAWRLPARPARVLNTWALQPLLACSLLGATVPVGSRCPPCPCSRLQCSMRLCRVLSCFLSLICLA
jgi:hypothetical protein